MQSNLAYNFRPENIPAAVSAFRPDNEVPVLNERHFDGGQRRVYKVDFLNGESWAICLPIHVRSDSQDTIISLLRSERNIFQELGEKGFPWAPKPRGSILTFENLVGFPFLALVWIEGSPLSWSTTYPPRPVRDKVLRQVAEIQLSLIECTGENGGTATPFFLKLIDSKVHRIRNGKLPELTEQDCFDQRKLLPQVLLPELENAPFAIDHGDLSPLNILVDSEHNVTGIIDWGFAGKAPVQLAGRLPRFLQLPDLALTPSQILQEDRTVYVASLRSHSSQVASWMSLIQSTEDVDFRDCFLESLISKGMHRSLAGLGWELPNREPRGGSKFDA
ncbi:hypothetical protein P152DRAFT_504466 [Eremomyces bilateralis CBS 781.70]|uniref:Aminoglycoside phosphotransferase domain-containing protein n=1 Tax=Eremomyces bilateralis CBS 781.70 TaxID=1392243 RepID=A0A6G1GGE1_9PEZI|nr:uncharacterized protein P152DRAFT_504466 [Eremomyces bilateralis CBS 781.70]KAF1817062.1 hypothetical protein P152DRAFT_504466 [Eremomyces bilateralis CBS 781.70]